MQCHNVVGWRFSPDRGEHSDTTMRRASHCRCLQHATRVETSVKPMPTTCATMLKLLALRLVALLLETQLQAPMTTRVHIQQPMSQQMMTSSAQHVASLARGGTMHGKLSTSAWACSKQLGWQHTVLKVLHGAWLPRSLCTQPCCACCSTSLAVPTPAVVARGHGRAGGSAAHLGIASARLSSEPSASSVYNKGRGPIL